MSSRQQSRLRTLVTRGKELSIEGKGADDDDGSSDEDVVLQSTAPWFSAAMLGSDSELESDSCSIAECDTLPSAPKTAALVSSSSGKNGRCSRPAAQDETFEDLLLDELRVNSTSDISCVQRSYLDILLEVDDGAYLDISLVMRSRLSAMRMSCPSSSSHRKGAAAICSAQRRVLLGPPDEDWVHPPHFIAGGLAFVRDPEQQLSHSTRLSSSSCDVFASAAVAFYKLEPSAEYMAVDRLYRVVSALGDVNRLFLFVLQNPYHCEGLLSLAMVFLRTGGVEVAHKLVRRCIYIIERALRGGASLSQGSLRVSFGAAGNRVVFASLFRHAQMCLNLGAVSTAADIAKIVFKLDPCGDPVCILLCLDTYCLMAKRFDFIDDFLGKGSINNAQSLTELPTWDYSRALSLFLRGDRALDADAALLDVVSRHPYALALLLARADVNVKSAVWSVIFGHKFFVKTTAFFSDLKAKKGSCALDHIFECYSIRSKGLWSREAVVLWMQRVVSQALSSDWKLGNDAFIDSVCAGLELCEGRPGIHRYLAADVDDFKEDYPRLPDEV